MASYLTRVELHRANEADYTRLHTEMERRGFSRIIQANDGVSYRLPTAEYHMKTENMINELFTLADQAVGATSRSAWIVVCQYDRCTFRLEAAGK